MIVKIAKNELRHLFYSPVAWFIVLVFFVQCAIFYTQSLESFANWVEVLSKNNQVEAERKGLNATTTLLLGGDGLFVNIFEYLFLFIPMLTMGVINREFNNGSIKLLSSSPVHVREIVCGKYLGLMAFNLLLLAIVSFFLLTAAVNVRNIDYGILLSALLGFYLFLAAFSAIGLYMSSITNYPIIAALSTFAVLFLLSKIGGLWQQYDFFRDLSWCLAMKDRMNKLLTGLIRTRDVIYYLVIVYIFVSFTLLSVHARRQFKPWYVRLGRYVAVVIIGVLVGYFSSRPQYTGYWDTTAQQIHTIPEPVQQLLQSLDKDSTLEITLYVNLLAPGYTSGMPASRNAYLEGLWDPYIRFKPGISFKYEYYYDYNPEYDHYMAMPPNDNLFKQYPGKNLEQIAALYAQFNQVELSSFKSPSAMRGSRDLDPEGYRMLMVMKYKGREEIIRTYFGIREQPWPEIDNIGAALKRLQNERNPKVAFVTGHLERNIYKNGEREFRFHSLAKYNISSLINLGIAADTVNLTLQDISDDVTELVLADPRTELSPGAVEKITAYMERGGNLLITGEPKKQHILNPILERIGVRFIPGQLASNDYHKTSADVKGHFTRASLQLAPEAALFAKYASDLKYKIPNPQLPQSWYEGAVAIDWKEAYGFTVQPIIQTAAGESWLKARPLVMDSSKATFTPTEGDTAGTFTLGVVLTRQINNKEQRIVVLGDSDLGSNKVGTDRTLVLLSHSWLNYNEYPLFYTYPYAVDKLRIGAAGATTIRILYVWVLPGLILGFAGIILIKRKRK